MDYQVTCPHCQQTFTLDDQSFKEIENQVLREYYEILKHQKEMLQKERIRLEKLKQDICENH
jgi:phage terminase large subunit GpA-like protein